MQNYLFQNFKSCNASTATATAIVRQIVNGNHDAASAEKITTLVIVKITIVIVVNVKANMKPGIPSVQRGLRRKVE